MRERLLHSKEPESLDLWERSPDRDVPTLPARSPWLFSARTDFLAFIAPALVSLLLVIAGVMTGLASEDTPSFLWLTTVLLVDVAHVWSTLYRVYTDRAELRRRPALYYGAPIAAFALGFALHLHSAQLFWRVLAYAAVFHFVRQQYGWMRLYRRKARDTDRLGALIDGAAIYLSTLGPLVFWHASSPKHFTWFLPGDFALGLLPPVVGRIALAAELLALALYAGRALLQASRGEPVPWGKHALVATTAVCWWIGIVTFDSDYVFTVTNVLIHGVPYFVLVWRYGARRYAQSDAPAQMTKLFRLGWPAFYLPLVALAFVEEGLWDKLVWHDHPQFFGAAGLTLTHVALAVTVALLAVPQATHYVLDGFIWRGGRHNPGLGDRLGL